jgi:hypothetical protein
VSGQVEHREGNELRRDECLNQRASRAERLQRIRAAKPQYSAAPDRGPFFAGRWNYRGAGKIS